MSGTTHEITKLIKKSPKRNAQLVKIQKEMSSEQYSGIRLLCPTRWTVRAEALWSIINNYEALQDLWVWALDNCKDTEMKSRIYGVQAHMMKFSFFFGLVLGHSLLKHADNLSATLQTSSLSAADGQKIAAMTVKALQKMRSDEAFLLFWNRVLSLADEKEVEKPCLPQKRKPPARFEVGSSVPHSPKSPEDLYRVTYYEGLDLIVQSITDRFNQKDYDVYIQSEELLLKAAKRKDY